MRYFLADILQFQFHRALAATAGETGPLNRASIYGSKAAGERLEKMMLMGASKPWPEALQALTGEREMDATAILDYFAPLKSWLEEQNRGRPAAGEGLTRRRRAARSCVWPAAGEEAHPGDPGVGVGGIPIRSTSPSSCPAWFGNVSARGRGSSAASFMPAVRPRHPRARPRADRPLKVARGRSLSLRRRGRIDRRRRGAELLIALAGPAVNLVAAAIQALLLVRHHRTPSPPVGEAPLPGSCSRQPS
jgi:hypothetical protein